MGPREPAQVLPKGVSQRSVADRIGVSVSTVSRVLSGHDAVSERTRADVFRAVAELRRESLAPVRSFVAPESVIGLTNSHGTGGRFPNDGETMLQEILGGAERAAQDRGYMVYTWHRSGLLLETEGEPFFSAVSGVVMTGGVVTPAVIEAIHAHGVPITIVGGHSPSLGVPSVSGDITRGTWLATELLIRLGHRRIALVNGPTETYTSRERRAGYLEALFDASLPVDAALVRWQDGIDGFSPEAGRASASALLDLPEPPTGIVFASDALAVGGQGVCQQRGMHVPRDISIVGFDDNPITLATSPQLTTIRVDRVSWGARAVDRLIDTIEGAPLAPDRLLLPVQLIERGSTGPAPARSGEKR